MLFSLLIIGLSISIQAQAMVCEMDSFSDSFQQAMRKQRASGDIVHRTSKEWDSYSRKWIKTDHTYAGEAREAARRGDSKVAGNYYRLNAEVEYSRGNWAIANKEMKQAAQHYEEVNRGRTYKAGTEMSRETFDVINTNLELGNISKAADFVDPKAYMDMGQQLQTTWLPDVSDAARIAREDPVRGINIYRRFYNAHRMRAEIYKRADEKFGAGGARSAAQQAEGAAAAAKNTMENIARSLP